MSFDNSVKVVGQVPTVSTASSDVFKGTLPEKITYDSEGFVTKTVDKTSEAYKYVARNASMLLQKSRAAQVVLGFFMYIIIPCLVFVAFAPGLLFSPYPVQECDSQQKTTIQPKRVTVGNAFANAGIFMLFLALYFYVLALIGVHFPFHIRREFS
jgi:hypothetical protein